MDRQSLYDAIKCSPLGNPDPGSFIVSDVLTAMDRGQITLLGMFDLSAAFDTVDHAILLKRLDVSFGMVMH